jgi:hypothetical protein
MNRTILILLLSGALPAAANPGAPPKPLSELKDAYDRALHYKSPRMIAITLEPLAASAAAEKQREWARGILRANLSHPDEAVRVAAARAYGTLAMAGSSKDLRKVIDRRGANREAHAVRLAAIESWGRIHDAGTYRELLDHIRVPSHRAERRELALAAVRALARYQGLDRRPRYELLREYMKTFDHVYGSAVGSFSASAEAWWGALSGAMVETFARLTGRPFASHRDCSEWWRENRRRVRAGRA